MTDAAERSKLVAWAIGRGLARTAADVGMDAPSLLAMLREPMPALEDATPRPLATEYAPLTPGALAALAAALASCDDRHVVRAVALDLAGLHEPVGASLATWALGKGSAMRPEARPLYAMDLAKHFPDGSVGGATIWAYAPEAAETVPRIVVADGRYGT